MTETLEQYHFFPLIGRPKCTGCGQYEGVALRLGPTGYSCGTSFEHLPTCPRLRCAHGVLWKDDCETCEAEKRELWQDSNR